MNSSVHEELQTAAALFSDRLYSQKPMDVGAGHYMLWVADADLTDLSRCLNAFLERNFVSLSGMAPGGFSQYVYTQSLTKEDLTLTVSFFSRLSKLYITMAHAQPLSPHLNPKAALNKAPLPDTKTKLHMLELFDSGNSFLIQLKNGHFILNDGGLPADMPYLLDYLEALVPAGEKPIIDAWFFSHAHPENVGVLKGFVLSPRQAQRICVEGVYFNHPSDEIVQKLYAETELQWLHTGAAMLKNADGKPTPVYRVQSGQRYYFHDITVDVVYTQEQLLFEGYTYNDRAEGYNETSVWLMYAIEGQKILLTGDADAGSIATVMETYPPEFWHMAMLAVPHQGVNVTEELARACQVATVLYTGWWGREDLPFAPNGVRKKENLFLQKSAQEFMSWGDGTKIFTFPYHPGEAERLCGQTWDYHPGYLKIVCKKRRLFNM